MRNLKRLQSAGIPSPEPHLLKAHVLVMDFLGKDGWCAPRLKDAELTVDQMFECYKTIAVDMRRMYHECNLVHGDLSEYNLLWHNERPVIIDVSQSVEMAHPFANDFLRKDVTNITEFFMRKGLRVLSKTELYNYVTDKYLTSDKNNDSVAPIEILREKLEEAITASESKRDIFVDEQTEQQNDLNEAVFLQSYIPTTLGEIANPYKEMDRINKGQREEVFENAIHTMLGLKQPKQTVLTHSTATEDEAPAQSSEVVSDSAVTDNEYNTTAEDADKKNTKTSKTVKGDEGED
eukprot:gene32446-40045_t